ncbi:MAG: pyridoxal 5'-phosphate synthase glutaminase subunit PdxT [Actinomycetota bacterium]
MIVGVLALQGAVREHLERVRRCGSGTLAVKKLSDLSCLDGLIIPGGESTTIGKLLIKYDFIEPIRQLSEAGIPIFGTCAGLILLAGKITEGSQPLLELMDIEARRNAFGRQRESFETDLSIPDLGEKPFPGVFIRAPWIESVGDGVRVMAEFNGKAVMARQNSLLVASFHPELTDDLRVHRYFLDMVRESLSLKSGV